MRALISILLAVLAARGATAGEGADLARALSDLGSPFLEAREAAVRSLSGSGAEAESALIAAYSGADFRKKALILEVFILGRPSKGLALVLQDLACGDRGVVQAQRRLVSTIYVRPRRTVTRDLVPLIPHGEWELEQLVRLAPAPHKRSRDALAKLAAAGKGRMASVAARVGREIAAVDEMRGRILAERASEVTGVAEGAREMLRRVWTHDVERALLAVVNERGRDGSYDGMFGIVGELETDETFRPSTVLLRIIRDEPIPEAGVAVNSDRPYEFLDDSQNDPVDIRGYAALCLGDIGSSDDAAAMAEYFVELPPLAQTGFFVNPKESIAQACSALGEDLPLRALIAEYLDIEEEGSRLLFRRATLFARLGMAYARIGNVDLARYYFRECIAYDGTDSLMPYNLACALARLGHVDEALEALWEARELGYGSERGHIEWMERDRDLESLWKTEEYRRFRDALRRSLRR